MNKKKHPRSNRAIPSCEMAKTISFIHDRFDGNSSADMLEKSTSDWIRSGKPTRKNMYYHYGAFLLSTRSLKFCRLDPIAVTRLNFPPTFACSLISVFSFLVLFFRFIELVHGHFHGLGLFMRKRIGRSEIQQGTSSGRVSNFS